MKQRTVKVAVAVVLFATSLSAADRQFWSTKKYTEWSPKEVEKLLKNSPWSKTVRVSSMALGGRGAAGGRSGAGPTPGSGAQNASPDSFPSDIVLYVTWYSRPVREALARQTMLDNPQAPAEEIRRILNYDASTSLDFVVTGNLGRILGGSADALEQMKEKSYLSVEKKQRVSAAAVLQPGGRNRPVVIRFARGAGETPIFGLGDKEVLLVTDIGGNTVRVNFKLADMVVNGIPEF